MARLRNRPRPSPISGRGAAQGSAAPRAGPPQAVAGPPSCAAPIRGRDPYRALRPVTPWPTSWTGCSRRPNSLARAPGAGRGAAAGALPWRHEPAAREARWWLSASCGEQGVQRREGRALTAPGNSPPGRQRPGGPPHRDLETSHPPRRPSFPQALRRLQPRRVCRSQGCLGRCRTADSGRRLRGGVEHPWRLPGNAPITLSSASIRAGTGWAGQARRLSANVFFVRADLVDFWRLLAADGVRLARHHLYPNPWPKIGQVARRWPGRRLSHRRRSRRHPGVPQQLARLCGRAGLCRRAPDRGLRAGRTWQPAP